MRLFDTDSSTESDSEVRHTTLVTSRMCWNRQFKNVHHFLLSKLHGRAHKFPSTRGPSNQAWGGIPSPGGLWLWDRNVQIRSNRMQASMVDSLVSDHLVCTVC